MLDVRKEINFCIKTDIPIIGVVENMSGFVCPNCKCNTDIFTAESGGAKKMCEDFNIDLIGKLPIDIELLKSCDKGKSYIKEFPEKEVSLALIGICKTILSHKNYQI